MVGAAIFPGQCEHWPPFCLIFWHNSSPGLKCSLYTYMLIILGWILEEDPLQITGLSVGSPFCSSLSCEPYSPCSPGTQGPSPSIQGVCSSTWFHRPCAGNSHINWSDHSFPVSQRSLFLIVWSSWKLWFQTFVCLVGQSFQGGRLRPDPVAASWLDMKVWHMGFPAATEGQGRELFPILEPNKGHISNIR